jgi:outer membrane protein with beta-barrel domain
MIRPILILLAALASLQIASSQDGVSGRPGTKLGVELGYYSPAKESFRLNYDQSLFFGSAGVPISLGLEFDKSISGQTDLFLAIRRINHQLKSENDITLALMPVTLGIHYYIPKDVLALTGWTPYLATGLEFHWTRFSAITVYTQSDPTPLGLISTTQSYFGYGITFGLGIEHPWNNLLSSSFGIDYDVNRLGSADEGGLGNVGGFLFHARMAFTL